MVINKNCVSNYKMVTKQINLKNRSYYFWNDQIWINNFDAKNLKLDKK